MVPRGMTMSAYPPRHPAPPHPTRRRTCVAGDDVEPARSSRPGSSPGSSACSGSTGSTWGKVGTGIVKLLTIGGFGIWWLVDLVLTLTNSQKDKDGRRVLGTRQSRRSHGSSPRRACCSAG